MSKRASEQRDDIAGWFASMPGLIFSALVLGVAGIWFLGSFVVQMLQQGMG